ncbi:Protein-export membrane protein SecF [Euzebya pacifica]|uniref:Protein-export membrane protein SecF n=1 Tax=Euzebya pacifica TaxID=1608957 RepID=A0A346XVZ5_9ACTN|nr:protein translocase subunit SecF [Euzebya pacifica]AXV06392.1 Protein-export membrane protein SecF [Euzebya pacifica]
MTDITTTDRQEDRDTGLSRLLTGRAQVDFIGRSRQFGLITLALILVSLAALGIRGLNFSIEFTGGSSFVEEGATQEFTVEDIEAALTDLGVTGAIVQVVDDGAGAQVSTPAISEISGVDDLEVAAAIEELTGGEVSVSTIGPRWGDAVTEQAIRGLIVFLVLVIAYITFRFEWRMAVSAVLTLLHDVIITVGLYALIGFTVSPSTVIAILTILGYSLYDTVVVFDRITEDSEKLTSVSTTSYGQLANGALNNVLVRSLSTSITSVLPVASLLFVGANLLGAATLSDLALALFIGMTVGTYSSIFIATPLLVWLKEKDPKFAELKERAERGGAAA